MLDAVTTWLQVAGVVLLAVCAGLVVASLVGGVLGVGCGAGASGVACWAAAGGLGAVDRRVRQDARPVKRADELGRRRAS